MDYRIKDEIRGNAVDNLIIRIPSEENTPDREFNDQLFKMWQPIASPHRPKPVPDQRKLEFEPEEGSTDSISVGGGGMAATDVREYIIHPSLEIEAEMARLKELVEKLRIERCKQMDIMDRALHDPEYREKRAYYNVRRDIQRALERVIGIANVISQLAVCTFSDRSRILTQRAEHWMDSGRDIKFPPMPKLVEH